MSGHVFPETEQSSRAVTVIIAIQQGQGGRTQGQGHGWRAWEECAEPFVLCGRRAGGGAGAVSWGWGGVG